MVGAFIFSLQNVQGSHYWGILFAADRIFYGQVRPEDIPYCIVIHEN